MAMEVYLKCTELWEKTQEGKEYLMNTIEATSKFQSIKLTDAEHKRQHTPEIQLKIARELKQGWIMNGPKPFSIYRIVQKWSNGTETVVN